MKTSTAFWAGVAGAVMITLVTAIVRFVGIPMNMEMMVGSMLTGTISSSTWMLGLVIHLAMGGLFGLLYGALFERATHRAGIGMGLAFGAAHAVIVGLILGLMPIMHPAMPDLLPAPGAFAINLGLGATFLFIVLHLAYGAIVGGAYAPVTHPVQRPATATR